MHKLLKGFGKSWQYSVFFCVLKDIDRVRMEAELTEIVHLREDTVMIVDLGADEEKARAATVVLGPGPENPDRDVIVI